MAEPLSFLIIRLTSIGDVLHCTPVARELRQAFPSARITWLSGEVPADLLRSNPYIDELYVWPRERWEGLLRRKQFQAAWKIWGDLKTWFAGRHFDVALDVHGLFLTGLIARMSRAGRRIGMQNTRELNWLFMTEQAPLYAGEVHVIQRYLSILRPLGIDSRRYDMTLVIPPEAAEFADSLLRQKGVTPGSPLIAVCPSTTWQSKNWPPGHFAAAARLLAKDARILLCGGPGDKELAREIIEAAGVPIINTVGETSLIQLAGLLSRTRVLLTGDTGPLHMAVAVGTPTVSVWGPTDPRRFGPLAPGHIVLENDAGCPPCFKQSCPKKDWRCLPAITPEAAADAVLKLINHKD